MSKLYGCIVPHPPIIVPEIGGVQISKVSKTVDGIKSLSKYVQSLDPDIAVVISPHTPIYQDTFTVNISEYLSGSLSNFNAPELKFKFRTNKILANEIHKCCANSNLPCSIIGTDNELYELDHGIMVPFYYLFPEAKKPEIVSITISMLPPKSHYAFGEAIKNAVLSLESKVIFVASGDLSHRLFPGAPAGYSPNGKEFDNRVCEIVENGGLNAFTEIDPYFANEAGECGLRSFQALAGYFSNNNYKSELISYECPFGVGYLVAYIESK